MSKAAGPKVAKSHAKSLARLEHMAERLAARVEEYAELGPDHPDVIRFCASNMHDRENLPALRAGLAALKYADRGPELLSQLVEAVRCTRAARTVEERAQASALLDEAFDHARALVDQ